MDKNRSSEWVDSSQGLRHVEMLLVGNAQGLGLLDVELIQEFPKLNFYSKLEEDRLKKLRHITLSELWVMGAYELTRLINEINKERNFINGHAKEKLKEVLTIFTNIRTPLAKLQKSGKEKRLFSQIATKSLFDSNKGLGWHLYDGKTGTIIFRKDLSDSLLGLLKKLKEDFHAKH